MTATNRHEGKLNRREFLRRSALAGGAAAVAHTGARAAQNSDTRPNILWFVGDDHAAYVTGCYGNPLVRTPHLDRLAGGGMRFDRAFCNSPVCSASRQSFLTGRYPRTVGVSTLAGALPADELTLAEILEDAGYTTAAFGKMHFNSNLPHGFDRRLDVADHGRRLKAKGGARPVPRELEVQPPWRPFKDPARIWLNSRNLPAPYFEADAPSTFLAEEAARFLAAPHDQPFFLMVGFYEPHSPFNYPIEYRGRHDPAKFPVYRVGPEDDEQIPAIFRDLAPDEKRGIQAACYTSTEFLDSRVGLVLDALERSGRAGNTLVIHLGDNGYQLGQHGRFEKHCMYEESVRVPLLMRLPGRIAPGATTHALVEFIDIVPTVLDHCGVKIPARVQGRSLAGLLSGKTARHRDHVVVEYGHNEEIMVRDEDYKFIFVRGKRDRDDGYTTKRPLPGNTTKLFDLKNDPGEFANVARKPEHKERVGRYLALLAEHIRTTDRQPGQLPKTDDPMAILDYGVQPRDRDVLTPRK